MVTAAHCGGLNSTWRSGTHAYGSMTRRATFPEYDMALLSGSSYGSYIWMAASVGEEMPTGEGANPGYANTYCSSGARTYQACNKQIISLSGEGCDASGCTQHLAVTEGGTNTIGGDSGGPLVLRGSVRVFPRGIIVGTIGDNDYFQRYGTIASIFNVRSVETSQ